MNSNSKREFDHESVNRSEQESSNGRSSNGSDGQVDGEAATDSASASSSHKRARTQSHLPPPSPFNYNMPSILASMTAESAAQQQQQQQQRDSAATQLPHSFHSSLTNSLIQSPRRATVCSSLENAAMASSLLTQSTIHPAILHSLSVRLQALPDADAEIVLSRLLQLARHMEAQSHSQNAQREAQLKFLQSQAIGAASTTTTQPQALSPARLQPSSSAAPPSPLPVLSSSSSVSTTDNTSNSTSPTISPALAAVSGQGSLSPPPQPPSQAPHSPQARSSAAYPPLHPHLPGSGSGIVKQQTLTPYAQMLLSSSNGITRQQQQQQQQMMQQLQQQTLQSSKPISQPTLPLPNSASSSIASAVPSAAATAAPALSSSASPTLHRSHSDDNSTIPLGLMMLIEAMPGTAGLTSSISSTTAGSIGSKMEAAMSQSALEAATGAAAAQSTSDSLPLPTARQRSTSC